MAKWALDPAEKEQRASAVRPLYQRLRKRGIQRKWLQEQLRQRGMPLSLQTLWNYEHGIHRPTARFVEITCELLDIDAELLHIETVSPHFGRRKGA